MIVVQEWLGTISMMQQSVLLSAIRGCDGTRKHHPSKYILRWLRRYVLLSAMDGKVLKTPHEKGGGSFTGPSYTCGVHIDWEDEMNHVVSRYLQEVDSVPLHFHTHLMHAAEILGYKHPDEYTRMWRHTVYVRFVKDMHLAIEREAMLDYQLGDNREQWLAHSDEATS